MSCGGGVEAAMDTLNRKRKPEGYKGDGKGSAVLVFLPVLVVLFITKVFRRNQEVSGCKKKIGSY